MKTQLIIRLAGSLYEHVKADLARPHPFAAERVGFLFTRVGTGPQGTTLLFPVDYMSLQDDQYIDENDPRIGAAINGDAIRSAMQHVLNTEMGALHIHIHTHHRGRPYFSSIDWRALPGIVQSLQNANPQLIHGALLFSQDTVIGALWPPEQDVCNPVIPQVSIVGYPLRICTGEVS
jgi:hypothetical protein